MKFQLEHAGSNVTKKARGRNKMKNERPAWKITILIVIALMLVVAVPIAINEAYKTNSGYLTLWGAEDVLAYYGTLLGATATIAAVILTIRFTKKQQFEERITSAKPYLSSETFLLNTNEEIQSLENGQTLFAFDNDGTYGTSTNTNIRIRKNIHQINKEDCAIKYILTNIGGDSATNVRMYLDSSPLIPEFGLGKDKEKVFVFLLKPREGEDESKFCLSFEYGDIVSKRKYKQQEILIIKKENIGLNFVQSQNDLLTAPVIKEDTTNADT